MSWSCGILGGLWCPSIRGGSVDGAHGEGGLGSGEGEEYTRWWWCTLVTSDG